MSAVFFHDSEQYDLAAQKKDLEATKLNAAVYTEIIPYSQFYPAEDYHQKYALQHDHAILKEFRSIYPSFERIVSSTAAARVNGYLGGFGDARTLEREISSYGLSPQSQKQLMASVRTSARVHCVR
jgi:peptide-methionine (S)-S-oxide reductase